MLQLSLTQPSVRSYTASSPLRHDGIICILLNPATKRWLYAMALSFCLLMLIMLIILSFVCCQRVLVGQWHDWPSCTIVLAAVSGRRAAGPPGTTDVPNVSRAVLTGRSTVSGFDLAWFSFLSFERLCIFGLHGTIIDINFSAYILLFTF